MSAMASNKCRVQPFTNGASSVRLRRPVAARLSNRRALRTMAKLGGGDQDDQKVLKREEEPDQYWQTAGEAKGSNPMKDPLAIIGVIAILSPFVLLGIAIATGVVDTSVYRGN